MNRCSITSEADNPGRRRRWVSRQEKRKHGLHFVVVSDELLLEVLLLYLAENLKPTFRKYQFVTNDRDISPSQVLAFSLPSRLDNM